MAIAAPKENHIYFPGNPWSEGHLIEDMALAYAGDYEFKYAFEAHLFDLEAPKI